MKHIITAIGNRELNDVLRRQDGIKIESSDIQYQEGIIETLEKYPEVDMVILSDEIIGNLGLEELIINIVMAKKNIEIILITEDYLDLKINKNVMKIVNNKHNYVDTIIKFLITKDYISNKNVTLDETEMIKPIDNIIRYEKKQNIRKSDLPHMKFTSHPNESTKINLFATEESCKISYEIIKAKSNKKENVVTIIGEAGSRKNNFYFNIIKNNQI